MCLFKHFTFVTLLLSRLPVLQPSRVFYLFTTTTAETPKEADVKPSAKSEGAELSGNGASGSLQEEESEGLAGNDLDKEAGATGVKEAGVTGSKEAGDKEAKEAETASPASASSPAAAPSSGQLGESAPGPGDCEGSPVGIDQVRKLVSSLQEDLISTQTSSSDQGTPGVL